MKHLTHLLFIFGIAWFPFNSFVSPTNHKFYVTPIVLKDSIGVTLINGMKHVQYRVSSGETPYSICKRYRISYYELLATNPQIEKGLKVGQIVNVPYHFNATFTEVAEDVQVRDTLKHVVQPGETLYGLANRYHTSVDELIRLNSSQLKVGQVLIVGIHAKAAPAQVAPKASQPVVVDKKEPSVTAKKDTSAAVASKVALVQPDKSSTTTSSASVDVQTPSAAKDNARDNTHRVLVIPFDPYLYFSDADVEIANRSKITSTQVRYAFRNRLNALLEPSGYETIYLLGGKVKDSTADLGRAYASVAYGYQNVVQNAQSRYNEADELRKEQELKEAEKTWLQKQKEKLYSNQQTNKKAHLAKEEGQYFGVKVKDPSFYTYFNQKYNAEYYIFVSQFEVKTNYEHCLDRQREDYERNFIVHFSIFDANGNQIAGNKYKVFYNSNSNFIQKILNDNMPVIANRIMAEVPLPNY